MWRHTAKKAICSAQMTFSHRGQLPQSKNESRGKYDLLDSTGIWVRFASAKKIKRLNSLQDSIHLQNFVQFLCFANLLMEPRYCHQPATTMTADITSSNSVWSAGPWLSAFYINQGNANPKGLLFKTGFDCIICCFKVAASVKDRWVVADYSVLSYKGLQLALFFWNCVKLKTACFVSCL